MAELMDMNDCNVEKQILSPASHEFFDAEEEPINAPADNEDDDFLKKIDEAINDESSTVSEPPVKKICLENDSNSQEETLKAKESFKDLDIATAGDELLKDDENDENNKNGEDTATIDEISNELEDILNSVQNEDEVTQEKSNGEDSSLEKNESELTKEDANDNLLELCESPVKNLIEELSNESASNEDNEGESNVEAQVTANENMDQMDDEADATVEIDDEKSEESVQQMESNDCEDDKINEEKIAEMTQQKETINCEAESDEMELKLQLNDEKLESESESCKESESMDVDQSSNNKEAEMTADEQGTEIKMETAADENIVIRESNRNAEIMKTVMNEDEAKPVQGNFKKENIQIKLEFMKKFAKSFGKLSRNDLEELLIEKITEAIVFRSEYTELRGKCEKQDEVIENLKLRIQSITKQYNDLDMIHKRIVKDLKERPDQPITPVKITRAVGLQVYQPHNNTNSSNNLKQKNSPTQVSKPTTIVNKRPSEPDLNDKEAEAKRKKSNKIITPMRPPLSEKEKASLEKQEATIEQKIRTKVIKPDVAATPILSKPTTNGMLGKAQNIEKSPATQSIDLTDEDDSPASSMPNQQPPALVAIQKNSFINPRGLMRSNPMVRSPVPNIVNRMDQNRMMSMARYHPAPLPQTSVQPSHPGMKKIPPRPTIKINNVPNGIIVSWTVDTLSPEHAEIHSYQIYAYEETRAAPSTESWKHVGDVKALLLPMAVTLTQFQEGQKYHFAVRAVDIHRRIGQFSLPKTW